MKNKINQDDIRSILTKDTASFLRPTKKLWLMAAIIVVIFISGLVWLKPKGNALPIFKTAEIRQDRLIITVTATGTLEPVNQVEVGTEVSGTLKTVEVDYNDRIEAGQVLARLDTTRLEASFRKSEASLEVAKASLLQAEATVFETRNELNRLQHVWKLTGGKTPSKLDLDVAKASLKRALAEEASANARIAEAEAEVVSNKTELEKATIKSPINGIVLERSVEPGQTVAASLQAPVLFTLAEDLTQMRLHVSVDEADVGQVREGQEAAFTVDAYPTRQFSAKITQVRYAAVTEENVVTYETLLSVDNSDLLLRPGMTATADIVVQHSENVLLVPNTALRFKPQGPKENAAAGDKEGGLLSKLMPRPPRRHRTRANRQNGDNPPTNPQNAEGGELSCVWVLRDGRPHPVRVSVGESDGIVTQVTSQELKPGDPVIIGASGA